MTVQSAAVVGPDHAAPIRRRSVLVTGVLLGVAIIAFADGAIFHQLLQWHPFYWGTDEYGRILSDGLFRVFSIGLLFWGSLRLWQTPRDWMRSSPGPPVAAIFIGAEAVNAYDG